MMRSLTPILSLVISVLLVAFFVMPQYTEIQSIQQEIDKHTDAIAKYDEFTSTLAKKLEIKTSRSAAQNEQLDKLVPESIDDTKLLVDLEALAQSHNLLFGNTEILKSDMELKHKKDAPDAVVEESDELDTVDISFDVLGTYDQFKQFILDVERSSTLFEVTKISFDSSNSPYQQISLTVRVYALPEK